MRKHLVFLAASFLLGSISFAQNAVGIGTITPLPNSLLHVETGTSFNQGFIVTGQYNAAAVIPNTTTVSRMFFFPGKAVFRVGAAFDQWSDANCGAYSFAAGSGTIASGIVSTAFGQQTVSSGLVSMSIGYATQSKKWASFSTGKLTIANADASTTMGEETIAKSYSELVIGRFNDTLLSTSPQPFLWEADDALFIVGNGSSNVNRNNALVLYKNGNLVVKNASAVGSDPGGYNTPVSGAGTRLMWLPEKSAFRAGTVVSNRWDGVNIGLYSFASGRATVASGTSTTAMGDSSLASGNYAFAAGIGDSATGVYSTAIGAYNKASGIGAIALGYNAKATLNYAVAIGLNTNAAANYSVAMGEGTTASGLSSTALGSNSKAIGNTSIAIGQSSVADGFASTASGYFSVAGGSYSVALGCYAFAAGDTSVSLGYFSSASGGNSTAMGYQTQALGKSSTSAGHYTIAKAYSSMSIGRFNDEISSSSLNNWVPSDPLLIVGNGISGVARSNALVVYKNGNTDMSGFTRLGKVTESAPVIKLKKLSAVSSNSQNTWVNVAHGLNKAKIISVNIIMAIPGFVNVPPGYTYQGGYEYQYQISDANIVVVNTNGNSANILSKNFTILVTYEE